MVKLLLFDFDGLLVNTEALHHRAYKVMLERHGVDFDWSFEHYCSFAHYSASGLRDSLYASFPQLQDAPPWEALYEEKKQAYLKLVEDGVTLMPGVEHFLQTIDRPAAIVTHSPKKQVDYICSLHPILQTIPTRFTRECYSKPKPHPECYLKAIETLNVSPQETLGFEDTPRGITALLASGAGAVFVTQIHYRELASFQASGVTYIKSFENTSVHNFDECQSMCRSGVWS